MCLVLAEDPETRAFVALVNLAGIKRTVRLKISAVRVSWSLTVKDFLDSFLLIAKVSYITLPFILYQKVVFVISNSVGL